MKKYLLALSFFISFAEAQSQSWANPGAIWHFSFMQLMAYGYIEIHYTGDTIVQGHDCNILTKTMYAYVYPGYLDTFEIGKAYLYEYNKVVYYYRYQSNIFDTLYNFNALPGDGWKVRSYLNTPPDSGYVYVDSTSFEVINGDTLKCLFVSPAPGSCVGWYQGTKITERIGSVNSYMFPDYIDCIMDANEGGPLRCYSDSAFPQVVFDNQQPCDFITSVHVLQSQYNNPEVIFNAQSGRIEVYCSDCNSNCQVQMFNLQGIKIWESRLSSTPAYCDFNISTIPAGIYIISITDEKRLSYKKKIALTF